MSTKTEDDPLLTNNLSTGSDEYSGAISIVPEEREETTVQEILDEIGFTFIHFLYLLALGTLGMLEFYQASSLAIVLPILICDWNLSGGEQAFAVSLTVLGNGIGSLCIGPVADKFGRKPPAIIVTFLAFLFTAMNAAFSHDIYLFTLFSTLTRICTGAGFSICLTYWIEVSSLTWRRMGTLIIAIFWCNGFSFASALGYTLLLSKGWEAYFYSGSFFGIIPFIILPFLPESPKYLNTANKEEQVRSSLQRINFPSKDSFNVMIQEVAIKKEDSEQLQMVEAVKFVCSSEVIFDTIRMAGLFSCSKSIIKGLIFMFTTIFTSNYCNITLRDIIAVSQSEEHCNVLSEQDFLTFFYVAVIQYVATIGAIVLTNLIGQILTIKILAGVSLVTTLLMLICMSKSLITVTLVVVFAGILGLSISIYTVLPQVYPTKARTSGMGIVSGISVFVTAVILFILVLVLSQSVKGGIGLIIFLAGAINIQVWLPGLKDKIDEVTEEESAHVKQSSSDGDTS